MKSSDLKQLLTQTHCPIASTLDSQVYEPRNQALANKLGSHIDGCPECKAEVQRLNAVYESKRDKTSLFEKIAIPTILGMLGATGLFLWEQSQNKR